MAEVAYDKRLINVDEYYRMAKAGILGRDDRVELIKGEIINMSPIGSKHAGTVDQIAKYLHLIFGKELIIRVQSPIHLSENNEPEPDISILKHRDDFYKNSHPTPKEVQVIIEVSDSSHDYDLHVKSGVYALAEIPEYWVVDLYEGALTRFTNPLNGEYSHKQEFAHGQSLNWSGNELAIKDLIG